jgi:hypothetical protein
MGRQAEDVYTGSDWDLINKALMDEDAYQSLFGKDEG